MKSEWQRERCWGEEEFDDRYKIRAEAAQVMESLKPEGAGKEERI